jgi:hypothetical protein
VADNRTYSEILLGGIVATNDQFMRGNCYHQSLYIRIALGMNVSVNTVIGMHTIDQFCFCFNPGDRVIEPRGFEHASVFRVTYDHGKLTVPRIAPSRDSRYTDVFKRLDEMDHRSRQSVAIATIHTSVPMAAVATSAADEEVDPRVLEWSAEQINFHNATTRGPPLVAPVYLDADRLGRRVPGLGEEPPHPFEAASPGRAAISFLDEDVDFTSELD